LTGGWIVVASAEHVARGVAGGFMQAGHGKLAPLRRIATGDAVICYSPSTVLGGADKLQALTAFGVVQEGAPYQVDMGEGFQPFRRNVAWRPARQVPIRPLLERLELTAGVPNWGYRLRFGVVPIGRQDVAVIAKAMGVETDGGRG
jgi:hypothetical protein